MAVRDALRRDAALRDEYAVVKKDAGVRAANIDEYGQAKTTMVQKILEAAGLTADQRASIAASQVPSHDELPRQGAPSLVQHQLGSSVNGAVRGLPLRPNAANASASHLRNHISRIRRRMGTVTQANVCHS